MKHRLSAAFAAALSVLPLLTGCGSQQQSSAMPETGSVTAETADTTEPAASSADFEITDPFQYEAGKPEITDNREGVKDVFFYRDGIRIRGQLFVPKGKGPFPTVVLCSGMTVSFTNYNDEAEKFAANGYAAVVFDFIGAVQNNIAGRGSGGEPTEYSVLTEAKDLNVILDSLSALPKVDPDKVFLFGHSLGGLVATYIGCRRPDDIRGVMLVEPGYPFPDEASKYIDGEANGDFSQIPETVTNFGSVVGRIFLTDIYDFDIYRYMPECRKDVLIFLGTQNSLGVDHREYFDRAEQAFPSAEVKVIEGADHNFQGAHGEQMTDECLLFLRKHLADGA